MNRREFLARVAALAALALPGCAAGPSGYQPTNKAALPPPPAAARPVYGLAPGPARGPVVVRTAAPGHYVQPAMPQNARVVYTSAAQPTTLSPAGAPPAPAAPAPAPMAPLPPPTAVPLGGGVTAISRNSWRAMEPLPARCTPMNGVTRITIHHEGNPRPNNDLAPQQVIGTLQRIQKEHRARMNAADIGYHYIIDRTGRVWQGREERYQGAHVASNNSHNLGIMLMGNFNIQQPTAGQMASLERLLRHCARVHRVPRSRIHCHGELANTKCPGNALRARMDELRRSL